jgi:hypothetical protein
MPEYEHDFRRVAPARLSSSEFREIESILGDEYRAPNASVAWSFAKGRRTNSADSLDAVLAEIEAKRGICEFEIAAENEHTSITITGDDDGCFIAYESSQAELGRTLQKVRAIEAIFREHKRITAYLPNFAAALRRPALDIGEPAITLHLSRDEIIQGVLTRWLATVLTAPISFVLGFFIGRLTS